MKRTNGPLKRRNMSALIKTVVIYSAVALIALFTFWTMTAPPGRGREVPISQALQDIKGEKVKSVLVEESKVFLTYKDDKEAFATIESNESFVATLKAYDIDPESIQITIKDQSTAMLWARIVGDILPIALIGLFIFIMLRQAREAGSSLFAFGQSRAKLFTKDMPRIRFADVAGVDEAKKELEEVVEFLKTPEKFKALGARTPKGVLLLGPAGTGKTLLSRAVAGEASVPFFSMAGSEFMEMLVGVGAARTRDLFQTAKKNAPSIIFIDEIESIGRQRGMGFSGGHDEREQTLNQILIEMDGFTPNDNVVVIGASNRPDLLDTALIRPGRFDRRVVLDLPDIEGRKAILEIHKKGKPFEEAVNWDRVARRTVGFSGADLANMLNEAAILAARLGKKSIGPAELEEAATKVKLGPEKKRLQSEEDRRMTAYHEGGHALVAHMLPEMDPVHRVSIVSRGMSLGHTMIPPAVDRYNETRTRLLEMVTSLLGGRAAEALVFDEYTVGAASDLDKANAIVRQMVTEYGMSKLGPIATAPKRDFGIWPKDLFDSQGASQDLAAKIDTEIMRILDECYKKAALLLSKHRTILDRVAQELMQKETIEGEEFEKLVGKTNKKLAIAHA